MNLPFPTLTPRIVDPRWFTADTPCDEEIEVAMIEQKFQIWVRLLKNNRLYCTVVELNHDNQRKSLFNMCLSFQLTSVGQRYLNMNPLGKIAPEPMEEEAETDEEEGMYII